MCGGGGDGGAADREAARQGKISQGLDNINKAFAQFDEPFFQTREQAYLDFATPQLEDQFQKEKENLIFALARNGRLNSKTRSEKLADLEQQLEIQRTGIFDKARGVANQARGDIEQARSSLVSQNASLANPASISNLASNRAGSLAESPSFEPLGALFDNASYGLASAAEGQQRKDRLQSVNNLFPADLFGSGASRVVR